MNAPFWKAAIAVACLLAAGAVRADISQDDKELASEVAQRLLAVAQKPAHVDLWPPRIVLVDRPVLNAFATNVKTPEGKLQPVVCIFAGMLDKVIKGQPDRLAWIMGHELSHILLGHTLPTSDKDNQTVLLQTTLSRRQELDADRKGLELALAAGYSFQAALTAGKAFIDHNLDYSPIEGLVANHPAWTDRLAAVDKDHPRYWRAMSAFNDGVTFLSVEQYLPAKTCFDAVTAEFPEAAEAWANAGYAKLMMYCDKLDTRDIRSFGVGYLVCGGFYKRHEPVGVKGIDAKLWDEALGDLQTALRLSKESHPTLIRANLGLAYLVGPVKNAILAVQNLQRAATDALQDEKMDPMARAAVLINAGVGDLAGGDIASCSRRLDAGEQLLRGFVGEPSEITSNVSLSGALLYNRGMIAASASDRASHQRALRLMTMFLRACSPVSLWRDVAYDRYSKLCGELHQERLSLKKLTKGAGAVKPILSYELSAGREVRLAEKVDQLDPTLGKPADAPSASGQGLSHLRYSALGMELLTNDTVLAISLTTPERTLPLYSAGVGSKKLADLHVGMTEKELAHVLGGQYEAVNLDSAKVQYRYYRGIGVAARVNGGVIKELVIVQLPDGA